MGAVKDLYIDKVNEARELQTAIRIMKNANEDTSKLERELAEIKAEVHLI